MEVFYDDIIPTDSGNEIRCMSWRNFDQDNNEFDLGNRHTGVGVRAKRSVTNRRQKGVIDDEDEESYYQELQKKSAV